MSENGVMVFPETGRTDNSIDPAVLLALSNGGGFGGMNNPLWMMFMYPFIMPFMSMWMNGGWGGFGGFGGNAGVPYVANQLNNDAGRELIVQAINGRADALAQLAGMTNNSVENVRAAIGVANTKLAEIGGQIGMSGLQVINAVQAGDATIAAKLAECCCENRLAICQQTNALQSQLAQHNSDVRLQLSQNEASDQLAVCQQTNTLATQADRNTNSILGAIANQNTLITKEFCDLKERELQNKINTQGDIITQLRNQISNDQQTLQFNAAFHALDDKIDAIAAKQPNTVPVTYPNLIAANATPFVGQGYYPGNYGGWGSGYNGGIIL